LNIQITNQSSLTVYSDCFAQHNTNSTAHTHGVARQENDPPRFCTPSSAERVQNRPARRADLPADPPGLGPKRLGFISNT